MNVDKHKVWLFLIVAVIITTIIIFNYDWSITGQAFYEYSGEGSNTKYECPVGEFLIKSSVYRGEEGWLSVPHWGCCQYDYMCTHNTNHDITQIAHDYDVSKEYSPYGFTCFYKNNQFDYYDDASNGYTFLNKTGKEVKVLENDFLMNKNSPYYLAEGYCGSNNVWYDCFPKTGNYVPSDFPEIYCYNSNFYNCKKEEYGKIVSNALCFKSQQLDYYWFVCDAASKGDIKSVLGVGYLCNLNNWIKGEEGNISGDYVYHNTQWISNTYCKSCKKGEKCIFSDEYLKNLTEPIYSVLQTAEKTGTVGCSSEQQCIGSNHKAVAYDTVNLNDKQLICGTMNRWLKCTTSNKGVFSDSGKFVCTENGWTKKVSIEICYNKIDDDKDGDIDCKDSECQGLSVATGKCITSSIKLIGTGGTLSDDTNSLKPENLKKRSALCTKPTDCVNANGECIGYDTPYATSGGVFNCGKDNIWKKCTPEGKNVKSEGGLFICDGTKWKLSVSLEDIPGDKKEICDNGKDDDSDLNADCGDYTDCEGISCGQGCLCIKKSIFGQSSGSKKEIVCNDNSDNDKDGKFDCEDSDCTKDTFCKICKDLDNTYIPYKNGFENTFMPISLKQKGKTGGILKNVNTYTEGEDECSGDGTKVLEYFCVDKNYMDLKFFDCLSGTVCKGGACITVDCVPNCLSKTCGDDGCGGSCGICIAGETCQNGNCVITNYLDYQSDGCVNALDLAVLAQNLKVNFDPICKNKNPDFTPGEGDVTGQNGKPDGCVDALDIAVIAQDLGTKFNAACI